MTREPRRVPPRTAGHAAMGLAALALAVFLAGMGATAWMAVTLGRQELRQMEQDFQQAAEQSFARILREIQLFMEVLDSIRQLHTLSEQISPAAFEEMTLKGMIYQRRILGAYGFAQRIPHDLRKDFERLGGGTRFLVEADGRGGFLPRAEQAEYYPLTYQTPAGGLGLPTGYDFTAREADRLAIAAMAQHGIFALGGEAAGRPLAGEKPARYLFAPIFTPLDADRRELAGFAIGLFEPDRILAAAVDRQPAGMEIRLEKNARLAGKDRALRPWTREWLFTLANEEWRVVVGAEVSAWAGRIRTPRQIWAIGLAVSLLLAVPLMILAGQTRRVEVLVQRRTAELAEANRRLEELMEDRRKLEAEVLQISAREKARLGRDLHDSLGQKLTGALLLLGALRQQGGAAAGGDTEPIASTLREAIRQVRRIARGLAPVTLSEEGLSDALRRLAEETAALSQKQVEFYAEREGHPRDAATAEHLFWIAQEAVHNAVKHSRGRRIVISLDYEGSQGVLVVEDDGMGPAPRAEPGAEGGSGWRIMRHRADLIGGQLRVETAESGGMRVICRFPAV